MIKLVIIVLYSALTTFTCVVNAQTHSLEIELKNQPFNHIVLGKIKGDDFQPLDTILLHRGKTANSKNANYTFSENSTAGMYRLELGKTTYAKVMNEPPQQLDFIFNNEDLIFETDFEKPEEKLLVVLSEENRVWFEFLQKEKEFQKQFSDLAVELVYYRNKQETAQSDSVQKENTLKWEATATKYNAIQKQRIDLIAEIAERNPELFATKLIKMYNEPFLNGFLTNKKRQEQFQADYFNSMDFSDESLINSSVYTDKIFKYLTSYNRPDYTKEQLEQEYIEAVDVILSNTNDNPRVYNFILNYLVHGFEVLKMENVVNYIAENYQ